MVDSITLEPTHMKLRKMGAYKRLFHTYVVGCSLYQDWVKARNCYFIELQTLHNGAITLSQFDTNPCSGDESYNLVQTNYNI